MSNQTAFELFSCFFLTGRDQEARVVVDRQFEVAREAVTVIAVIVLTRTHATDDKLIEINEPARK